MKLDVRRWGSVNGWACAGSCALLLFHGPVHAADLAVFGGPWVRVLGASHLEAGAGSDFRSPSFEGEPIAVLSISNTGGTGWNLKIALEGNETQWPEGASIALKRSGSGAEAGISDGLAWRTVTGDLQVFFSGTGDYASVEILLRLDGITVQTPPGPYSMTLRYTIESS